jgi:hypothetical protein
LPEAPEPESDSGRDYEAEIAKLRGEIDGLKVVRPASGMSDADVKKLVKSELYKAAKSAPVATKPVDGEIKTAEPPVAPTEQAVREVLAKIDEEKAEQARLNRQATRVANLERTKTFITEGVPTFLKGQTQRLQLTESQISSLTPVLTTYLHQRADVRSEQQADRIDGEEVDNAATDEKLKQLRDSTLTVVSGIVSAETAEALLNSALRLGGGGATRGGDGAAPGGRNPGGDGGNNPRQRRGGNNN